MSRGWSWKPGDWWVVCDVCAKQTRASSIKKRWDGLLVCPDDFEMRHPQDLIKVRKEDTSVPFSRVEPADQFVVMYYRYTLADSLLPVDSFSRDLIINYSLADTVSISEDPLEHRYINVLLDTVTITEDFTYVWTAAPGFVDTIVVGDSFSITNRITRVVNGHPLNSQPLG